MPAEVVPGIGDTPEILINALRVVTALDLIRWWFAMLELSIFDEHL